MTEACRSRSGSGTGAGGDGGGRGPVSRVIHIIVSDRYVYSQTTPSAPPAYRTDVSSIDSFNVYRGLRIIREAKMEQQMIAKSKTDKGGSRRSASRVP
ncbi:hypothetical protein EVAR_8250_1 [Eumeta japonica]|uniref:Uncharacterized protein n=1 Tax=Eumeta variegata TaxID=151549 RepID=A0A4C1TFP6_EUMVA|nr:hypothetical protein EVAR_8250_1 [Eumeta japonica]